MKKTPPTPESVSTKCLFLDLNNPRFEPVKDEIAAINYLATEQKIVALAEDIVSQGGVNPLEVFGILRVKGGKSGQDSFTVLEGNRRLCAMKLLNDPDLAPANLRKRFQKLADQWTPIKTILAVEFSNREESKPWLERLHEGEKDGVGRRAWDAQQKQRHTGTTKNAPALAVMDYAEKKGWLAKDERKGLLTTMQRYLQNAVFRDKIGVDFSDREIMRRDRPEEDFDKMVKLFVSDVVNDKKKPMKERVVRSRADEPEIKAYGEALLKRAKPTEERVDLEVVEGGKAGPAQKQPRKVKPRRPKVPATLDMDNVTYKQLKVLKNMKLEHLHYSVCSLNLAEYAVLISVGVWSFFECLTAAVGRNPGTGMTIYLDNNRLRGWGFDKDTGKTIRAAIEGISRRGNDSKHSPLSGSYDPSQINNDWVTLREVTRKLIEEAIASK